MSPGCIAATELACRRGERLLFRRLSLAVGEGEALLVAGANGTGKSSLLRLLAGLLRPLAGQVQRTGAVGLLDERSALDPHLPLERALAFWRRVDGGSETGVSDGEALDTLGLLPLLDLPVGYLSTGQRKRAALARLIGQRAPIWLLDEPLNGLDADAARKCEDLVAAHCAAGGCAVIASHQAFAAPGMATLALAGFAP